MKKSGSVMIFPQYLPAKPMKIVMEMVTAMPENANALLIMSMHKIARIMDVSTYSKPLSFFLHTFIWIYQYIPASWTQLKWPHKSWKGHIVYIRKDKQKEPLYYVNLIRASLNFNHHLMYIGDFFIYFMNFSTLFTDSY